MNDARVVKELVKLAKELTARGALETIVRRGLMAVTQMSSAFHGSLPMHDREAAKLSEDFSRVTDKIDSLFDDLFDIAADAEDLQES
jgi:hypothetical protein